MAEPTELNPRALAWVSLLSRLDDAKIAALIAVGEHVTLRAGDWLFREGEEGNALYVVLSGRLEVLAGADDGGWLVIRSLAFGDAVGELAVLCAAPRAASVRAVRDCTLLARVPG